MVVYQKCKKNSFEEKYLKKLNINDNPNINCFIGFDFGFFRGMNVYYSNNIDKKLKEKLSECIKNSKVNLRLFTNYDCEFDIVVLLAIIITQLLWNKSIFTKKKKILQY